MANRNKREKNGEISNFGYWWRVMGNLKSAEKNLMDAMMEYAVEGDKNKVKKLEGEVFKNFGNLYNN